MSEWAARGTGTLVRLGGTLLPADAVLDKLVLLFGIPGAGKTAAVRLFLADLCRQAFAQRTLGPKVRLVVIDPTDALRDGLWASVPTDVPVYDPSLQSDGGLYRKISDDVRTEGQAATFAHDPTAEARTNELFWSAKIATAVRMVAVRFIRAKADWKVSDLTSVLTYFRYLHPVLSTDRQLKAFVDNDLQGKLGRDIPASVTGVTDRMLTAGGFDQQAEKGLSNREFLAMPEGVLYVRFREDFIASQGTLVAAQVKNLVTLALMR